MPFLKTPEKKKNDYLKISCVPLCVSLSRWDIFSKLTLARAALCRKFVHSHRREKKICLDHVTGVNKIKQWGSSTKAFHYFNPRWDQTTKETEENTKPQPSCVWLSLPHKLHNTVNHTAVQKSWIAPYFWPVLEDCFLFVNPLSVSHSRMKMLQTQRVTSVYAQQKT